MKLSDAYGLIEWLMTKHGLAAAGWRVRFINTVARCGDCIYGAKVLRFSTPIIEANTLKTVRNTVLHEIAHALEPGDGHGARWQARMRSIGGKPSMLNEDIQPVYRYVGICPRCDGRTGARAIPTKRPSCGPCCTKYAKGRYDARFTLVWRKA